MWRAIPILCGLFLFSPAYGQDVFVPRELRPSSPPKVDKEPLAHTEKSLPPKETDAAKPSLTQPAKKTSITEPPANLHLDKVPSGKADAVKFPVVRPLPANPHNEPEKPESVKRPAKEVSSENPRQDKIQVKTEPDKAAATKESPANQHLEKGRGATVETAAVPAVKDAVPKRDSDKEQPAKIETAKTPEFEKSSKGQLRKVQPAVKTETGKTAAAKEPTVNLHPEKVQSRKTETKETAKKELAKKEGTSVAASKGSAANSEPEKVQSAKVDALKSNQRPEKIQPEADTTVAQEPSVDFQLSTPGVETGSTKLADGFDYPVGKPEAEGYYKARGFRSGGHMGEDWDGVRGGDTDLKDPIYCIGNGIVVFARDVHRGWGNVVIVRHAFRENGQIKHIDSLYGHLHSILVKRGQRVARGQQVGTMGTAHGQYDAHLHLEIRKNLEIGMSRAKFAKSFSNYHDPSQFIESHRHLSGGGNLKVAMNTFTHDSAFHFDDAPNYPMRKHSTAQSAAALKQALSNSTR